MALSTQLLLVLFSTHIANSAIVYNNTLDIELHNFFEGFVKNFAGFQIVFHADNSTINLVNNVIRVLNNNKTYSTSLVFNHDMMLESEYSRPHASRMLCLIFSKNINFWAKLADHTKINFRDVIGFVSRDENLKDKIIQDGLELIKFAGNILLIEKNLNNGNN